ncbi:PD-(D/E)XK nuclease family protein [Litoribacter alkaliphilus]|uniref:PD-(D/E)XK nuclease family protein n=1 Tax=Litoribacter ruber TaxID=702568 RepID=A0AAP2CHF4_9BACT|nr:PD-(D/E)XK nuclease family protein [Litoribacter alkaliphilus]MBS9524773.1 PD-(D/E)XK nuclease family protein [Litoribacter alkaliphilus]
MHSFLRNTAQDILQSFPLLKDVTVVFPNRRAGLFFTQHLGKIIDKPQWLPEVKTIEDLFYGYAGNRPADNLTLIFELYKVYQKLHPAPEEFDRFYYWGEMILKDFNDLDQFLANAEKLYRDLSEIKEIETDLSYLTHDQIRLIREFWKSFNLQDKGHQDKFLKFWQMLHGLYVNFKDELENKRLAYGGMLYRNVIESLESIPKPDRQYVFVGFNAFTKTEEVLLKHFIQKFGAKIYWDLDAYYIQDLNQEAGLFFREYMKDPVFGPTFPENLPTEIANRKAKIKTYAIPLKVNQANLVGKLLEKIKGEEPLEETVVILPDEQLLFPTLHAMPPNIDKINVTMGYPVKNAPVYAFLEGVLDLQKYTKVEEGKVMFYHKPVRELLASPYLQFENAKEVQTLLKNIQETNLVYVPQEMLAKVNGFFKMLFVKLSPSQIFPYLGEVIKRLHRQASEETLQKSYLMQTYKQLNRLGEILSGQQDVGMSMDFFIRIFRQVFREVKLPFEGEPLAGLQVMGVLESRNLDFRRVIICNMNEESFPPGGGMNSMIPFNLRRAFGLPVQEQNDAIYAYTFYRLMHSAEEVHMIYTTAGDQGKAGEKSRYIQQMAEEMDLAEGAMEEEVVFVPVDLSKSQPISIPKNEKIYKSLERYVLKEAGERVTAFSPSALNVWLDCRLKFYFKYIAGMDEKSTVNEEVDPAVFGNLAHLSLEILYQNYIERKKSAVIEKTDFERLKQLVFPSIEKAIRKQYFLEDNAEVKLNGQLAIARDVLQKYVLGVLAIDENTAPFEIISLEAEKKYRTAVEIDTPAGLKSVAVGGIIDRVDRVGETVRLIDYKSGTDKKTFPDIPSLFDRQLKSRNKAAMQTLLYGLLYDSKFPSENSPLKPAIFNLREIFKPDFNPYLQVKVGRTQGEELNDYRYHREDFGSELRKLLEEVYDPEVPFDQTEHEDKCRYCPYQEICERG